MRDAWGRGRVRVRDRVRVRVGVGVRVRVRIRVRVRVGGLTCRKGKRPENSRVSAWLGSG